MHYLPEPTLADVPPSRIGILLINLGTPDEPTPRAVRAYLKEFLGDPRVVEMPRALWWLILNGVVLNTRPKQSAAKYASIWTQDGSPLRVHTEKQAALLRGQLARSTNAPFVVEHAMRYGKPSIPDVLGRLKQQGCQRILVLPMYPQYAASTTATANDVVFATLQRMRNTPALRLVRDFHDRPAYIKALANNINDYWSRNGRPTKLLMSFHGLPQYTVDKGDPYFHECQSTGRLLAQELGLQPTEFGISFQSRFGRTEWMKPYTVDTLKAWGEQKLGRVDVVCPGFVADCLETLEEIAMECKQDFLHAGGGEYHYIPCLNEREDWIAALAQLVLDHVQGWHAPRTLNPD